jgi:hypothetical protein
VRRHRKPDYTPPLLIALCLSVAAVGALIPAPPPVRAEPVVEPGAAMQDGLGVWVEHRGPVRTREAAVPSPSRRIPRPPIRTPAPPVPSLAAVPGQPSVGPAPSRTVPALSATPMPPSSGPSAQPSVEPGASPELSASGGQP